jgi:hypothetical protein
MECINLEGNYAEIGEKLGEWWGNFLIKNNRKQIIKKYSDWLEDSWEDRYSPLLINVIKNFPDIHEEISGITRGVLKTGLKTSFLHIFALCLAETGERNNNCSSVILKNNSGLFIAHNDEEETIYPLLLTKVKLRKNLTCKTFISISYPFQLFGSAAGMNRNFAFQGNSIGYSRKVQKLESHWEDSIPKTIFSRKMLELETIDDIEELFKQHNSTLPNHHYIAFQDKAFSIEIRPLDKNQFKKREILISANYEFRTNHFIDDKGKIDKGWIWRLLEDRENSVARYEYLQKNLKGTISQQMIENAIKSLAKNKRCKKHTSATLLFTISKTKHICEGLFYFDNPNPSTVIVEIG